MIDTSKKGFLAAKLLSLLAIAGNAVCLFTNLSSYSGFDFWYMVGLLSVSVVTALILFIIPRDGLCSLFMMLTYITALLYFLPFISRLGAVFTEMKVHKNWGSIGAFMVGGNFLLLFSAFAFIMSGRFELSMRYLVIAGTILAVVTAALTYTGLVDMEVRPEGDGFIYFQYFRYPIDEDRLKVFLGYMCPLWLRAAALVCFLFSLPFHFERIREEKELRAYERFLIHGYRRTEFAKATGLKKRDVYGSRHMDSEMSGHFGEYEAYSVLNKTLPGKKKFLFNVVVEELDGSFTEIDLLCFWRSIVFVCEAKRYNGVNVHVDPNSNVWMAERGGQKVSEVGNFFVQNWLHLLALCGKVFYGSDMSKVTIIPLNFISARTGLKNESSMRFDLDYNCIPKVVARCDDMNKLVGRFMEIPVSEEAERQLNGLFQDADRLKKYSGEEFQELVQMRKGSAGARHRHVVYAAIGNDLYRLRFSGDLILYVERLVKSGNEYLWTYIPLTSVDGNKLQQISKDAATAMYYKRMQGSLNSMY